MNFSLVAFLLALCCEKLNAQIYWDKVYDNLSYKLNEKPAPRRDAAVGFDLERNRVILFGGWQVNTRENVGESTGFTMPVLFDDTWEYNLKTKRWRPLSFSLIRPSARYGMLYSHNKYGLYISCGRGLFDEYYNDLWIYDFSEDQWRKMDQTFISITPEPRYAPVGGMYPAYEYSAMDSKSNMFLSMGRAQYEMFDNMYVYQFTDLRALNGMWERVFTDIMNGPFSFTHPHGRAHASSAMISPDELLIHSGCLSGGFSGGPCPSSDSWYYSYTSNKWEKVDSSCITPRLYSSMASLVSDGLRKSAVIFSGLENDRTILTKDHEYDDEIVLYDNLARKWINKRVQGFYFPEKRDGHVMCTGKLNNDFGVFMFGGYGHFSEYTLGDLWFLKINISSAFENSISSSFYSINSNYNNNLNNQINKCSNHFTTIHLHAILMFVGWAVLLNLSNLINKYFSKKTNRFLNVFYCILKTFGILFISAGIFFGFWSIHGLPHLAHVLIGLAAYLFALIQPIASYMKKKTTKIDYYIDEEEKSKALRQKSNIFYNSLKFLHKNLTFTAILLASINISLGVFYAVFDWYWVLIWFCYLGFNLFIYLIFEIRDYNRSSSKKNLEDLNNKSKDINESDIDVDEYESNLSKSGSTQQLRPDSNDESIRMEPLRYTNSINLNKSLRNSLKKTLNPQTPPPPYANKSKQQQQQKISTINLDPPYNQSSPNSIPTSTRSIKTNGLSYSQKINMSYTNDDEDETDNDYKYHKQINLSGYSESVNSSYKSNRNEILSNKLRQTSQSNFNSNRSSIRENNSRLMHLVDENLRY